MSKISDYYTKLLLIDDSSTEFRAFDSFCELFTIPKKKKRFGLNFDVEQQNGIILKGLRQQTSERQINLFGEFSISWDSMQIT